MESRFRVVLPSLPTEAGQQKSGKLAMKARIHNWLDERHLGWSPDIANTTGKNFINAFTDALWCIDGHERTLASRACSIPKDFDVLFGFNQPEKSKHRKKDIANLSCDVLNHHISTLNHFLLNSWMRSSLWTPVREIISQFTSSPSNYAKYLVKKNCRDG